MNNLINDRNRLTAMVQKNHGLAKNALIMRLL